MKLTLDGLRNKDEWKGYRLPSFDCAKVKANTVERPEWIHFGSGNIFRIFPAKLCQRLLDKGLMDTGIIAGEGFDGEIIDRIYKPHDNLTLAVTLHADGSIDKEVIASVVEAVKCDRTATDEWKVLTDAFTKPSLKMVSFTITEKGYALYNPAGELFGFYKEAFAKPIEESGVFLCNLTQLLYLRWKAGAAPLALVSMDNCSHNGDKLKAAIQTIAKAYVDNGSLPAAFLDYVNDESRLSFPISMIDKITPRPDDSVRDMLTKDGFEDSEPIVTAKHTYIAPFVNAEEAEYLVIEDRFPAGRPALEEAGVYFCDRETVDKVERMKVTTCLNPLHTALALSGCLLGYTLISKEMQDEDLNKMVHILGYKEGLPVVTDPGIIKPSAFIDEVIEKRIPNPFMPDTPQRIATDTSQKLSIRFGETIKSYLASDSLDVSSLKIVPLVYALYLRYLLAVDDEGKAFTLSPDPMTETLQPALASISLGDKGDFTEVLRPLLSNSKIFGLDVSATPLFRTVVDDFASLVSGKGAVRATIHRIVNG